LREELAEAKRQHKLQQLELDWLNATLRERDELRLALRELRAIVDARQVAEERLAERHREREIVRAKAAERETQSIIALVEACPSIDSEPSQ
jgi:hypothetical protein